MIQFRNIRWQLVFAALVCAAAARADIIGFTITNATYTATCVGGGTCTEVINGTFLGNTATQSIIPGSVNLNLTGSINATLDGFGAPPVCGQPGCTIPPLFYDANAVSTISPIEWNPTLSYPESTPTAFGPGTSLFIPVGCGGDVPNCGATGTFPDSSTVDNQVVSGTYTAIDLTVDEEGGTPSAPVFLISASPVAQVAGTIAGAGSEDYYSFYWAGGAFSASAAISGTTTGDTFQFTAGVAGSCGTLASQPLTSGDSYSATISLPSLAAGNYCIGLDETAGTDPNFAITFATPVTTPEPSEIILTAAGLAILGLARRRRRI